MLRLSGSRCYVGLLIILTILFVCGSTTDLSTGSKAGPIDFLSIKEISWLKSHEGLIHYASAPNYAPVSFINDSGRYDGILEELLREIESELQFEFPRNYFSTWDDMYQSALTGSPQVIGAIHQSPERSEHFFFSDPYITIPNVVVIRANEQNIQTLADLDAQCVAVVRGYAQADFLAKHHPGVRQIAVDSTIQGLEKVAFGECEGFITDLAIATNYIEELGISNLKVAFSVDFTWELRFAVSKEYPELHGILDKAIDHIGAGRVQEINDNWVNLQIGNGLWERIRLKLTVAAAIVLILLVLVLVWNTTLRRLIHKRTQDLADELKERLHFQNALMDSEEQYRSLVANLPGATYKCRCDRNWTMVFLSDTIQDICGYPCSDFLNNEVRSFQSIIFEDDREYVLHEVIEAVNRNAEFDILYRIRSKSGEIRWVHDRGQVFAERTGNRTNLSGVIFDVTDRKMAELARQRLEARLKHTQRLESIGTMAGGIAHDFNNILFAIIGNTEIAREDALKGSVCHECLGEIFNASKRASELVSQILSFARQTDSKTEIIDLGKLTREALRLLRSTTPTYISIKEDISPEELSVTGNPSQVHQVIINLCTNALHSMLEGGGQMQIKLDRVDTDCTNGGLANHPPGPCARLVVTDTGCGIAAENLDQIFDPFFTTKDKDTGTGLGLSIVHGIVTGMQGSIEVTSEVGSGTSITTLLPLCGRLDPMPESCESKPIGGEFIIIVDDEPSILRVTERVLGNLGYRVASYRSGADALASIAASPNEIDLVITDQTMPEMTGLELASAVQQVSPDVPVILSTGYEELANDTRLAELGIIECLIKPIDRELLSKAVRNALNHASIGSPL